MLSYSPSLFIPSCVLLLMRKLSLLCIPLLGSHSLCVWCVCLLVSHCPISPLYYYYHWLLQRECIGTTILWYPSQSQLRAPLDQLVSCGFVHPSCFEFTTSRSHCQKCGYRWSRRDFESPEAGTSVRPYFPLIFSVTLTCSMISTFSLLPPLRHTLNALMDVFPPRGTGAPYSLSTSDSSPGSSVSGIVIPVARSFLYYTTSPPQPPPTSLTTMLHPAPATNIVDEPINAMSPMPTTPSRRVTGIHGHSW